MNQTNQEKKPGAKPAKKRTATAKRQAAKQTKRQAAATGKAWPPPASVLVEALARVSGETPPEQPRERARWLVEKAGVHSPTEDGQTWGAAIVAAIRELVGVPVLDYDGNYPPRLDDGREWIDREEELEAAVSALPKEAVAVADAFCSICGLDALYNDAALSADDAAFGAGALCLQSLFRVKFLGLARERDAASMRAALSALSLADTRAALDAFAANPSAETFDDAQAALGRAFDEWGGRCLLVAPPSPSNPTTPEDEAAESGRPAEIVQEEAVRDWWIDTPERPRGEKRRLDAFRVWVDKRWQPRTDANRLRRTIEARHFAALCERFRKTPPTAK